MRFNFLLFAIVIDAGIFVDGLINPSPIPSRKSFLNFLLIVEMAQLLAGNCVNSLCVVSDEITHLM